MTIKERLLRGIGASLTNQVVNVAIQLLTLRIFVSTWGQEKNGEWLILSAVVSGLAMSDVGIATAAGNSMATHIGAGVPDRARQVYADGWWMVTVFSTVAALLLCGFVWLTPILDFLAFRASEKSDYRSAVTLLVVQTMIALQTSMLFACLRASGHLAMTINVSTGQRIVEFGLQCATVYFFQSFAAVAFAGLIVRIIEFGLTDWLRKRSAVWSLTPWSKVRRRLDRNLLIPAVSSLAFPMGQLLGNQAILYVVHRLLGPAFVTVFVAHRTLANIPFQLVQSIGHSVLPEFSLAFGAGDHALAKRLHRRACRLSVWIGISGCLGMGLIASFVLRLWTDGQIEFDSRLMTVMLFWIAVRSFWYTSLFVPMSINRHQRVAVWYLCATLLALLIAFPITSYWGMCGTVAALLAADLILAMSVVRSSIALVGDSSAAFWRSVLGYAG